MLDRPVLIGVVDSGTVTTVSAAAARGFRVDRESIVHTSALPDAIGHATNTIGIIRALAPTARLAIAQVFFDSLRTTPGAVASAIDWLAGVGATLINLSLGTTLDSAPLRDSCRRAHAAGRLLVASVPARGPPVFPAGYEGVLRVTGDARCAPGEFSYLGTERVDFGACPRRDNSPAGAAGGASIAAARVTGALGGLLEAAVDRGEAVQALRQACAIIGPQRPRSHLRQ